MKGRTAETAVLALVMVGCALASVSARAATIRITIDKAAFQQPKVTAKVGDTIEWLNRDIVDHTSTSRGGRWDLTIAPGKKARVTLENPGTLDYYCALHPNMTGSIVVGK